jgi:hypothetical protein
VLVATLPTGVFRKLVDSSDPLPTLANPPQPDQPPQAKKH